jgi:predicted nuclease of predicted toxin-antitoxin system
VKWLIDNALSPEVAVGLRGAGHDAIHVRDRSLAAAADEEIIRVAEFEDRVIVSADTDFGTILAQQSSAKPSILLFRGATPRRATEQVALILANFSNIEDDLNAGAIVVVEPTRLRIRPLPIPPNP